MVALDPGHGGSEPGASANGLVERELTWKIALYCKEALESYANVEVVLTRGSDEKVSLVERVNRAVDAGANVFVSLHLNSGPASGNGAEVWYPNDSSYRHELHEEGAQLSSKILEKLTALGLTDRGIKVRDSERVDGEGPFYYPDGSIQDYYTVIEASREAGIVGIIVEHAFLSNKSDSDKLKSEAFLKELGYADAEGIAETYKLSSGWEIDNGRWKLKLADGTYATSSWQQVKGKKYWFGADSYASPDGRPLMKSATISHSLVCLADRRVVERRRVLVLAFVFRRHADGVVEAGWNVVLARSADWQDGNGLDDGFGRTSLLLRRIGGHADGLGEGRRNLVLPVRLRGDADGLAEQGRLLVLAGPRLRRGWPRAGRRPRTASGTTSKAPAPCSRAAG